MRDWMIVAALAVFSAVLGVIVGWSVGNGHMQAEAVRRGFAEYTVGYWDCPKFEWKE